MAGLSKLLRIGFCMLAVAVFSGRAHAADLVIGVPSWPSAQVTAHVIAMGLKQEYGVEAELRERGTLTILADIDRGDIQVHPEIWLPNLEGAVKRYVRDRGSIILSGKGVPAEQNICITEKTQELTGITKLSDLTNPEIAAKFDTDGDGKGEMWIGAPTWSSTDVETVRAKSYGYDKTMTLLKGPEEVAMAAVDVAASLGQPIVFYCYAPHFVFKLHQIKVLEEPPYDPSKWKIVRPADDPEWLKHSKAGTAWDYSHFHVGYAASLISSQSRVAHFLSSMQLQDSDVEEMSYGVEVERKSPEEVAATWVAANEARIKEWAK